MKTVIKIWILLALLLVIPGIAFGAEQDFKGTLNGSTWSDRISDTAYDASSWDGVADIAPSKNAVRDKFETIPPFSTMTNNKNCIYTTGTGVICDTAGGTISDAAYDAAGWDGVTTAAPSKNAIRDAFQALPVPILSDATLSGTPVVITIKDQATGTLYYFKVYPTKE